MIKANDPSDAVEAALTVAVKAVRSEAQINGAEAGAALAHLIADVIGELADELDRPDADAADG